ncbi:MAG TPA: thioredoxin family protein [Gemmata sp.]|nr:thioredoxin family protein [Gemmata sp.]
MPARIAFLALLLAASPAAAQFDDQPLRSFADAGTLSAQVVPEKAKRGQTVTYRVTMTPNAANNVWTYPIKPANAEQVEKTKIVPPATGDLIFVTEPTDPSGHPWATKPGTDGPVQYSRSPVTWELKAVVSPRATPGSKTVTLGDRSRFQGCNNQNCVLSRPADLQPATFVVTADEPVAVEEQYKAAVDKAIGPAPAPKGPPTSPPAPAPAAGGGESGRKAAKPLETYTAELATLAEGAVKPDSTGPAGGESGSDGLLAFVTTAALWGLISLVTPCVFPMIPITVSIFMKHAHGSFGERMKLAGVYCLTIIAVLGVSAFALLKVMAWLAAHPVTNLLLAALFFVLALSLFGMYELTLPNFLSRRLQAKQAKGGVIGTVFGALAFTVISFTCVAPFLGGFAGISAADAGGGGSLVSVPTMKEILGGLAFATAFAAPFFVLALVPSLLKALPKSGGWLDSVKVVMGFLELAAALKFVRTAELRVFATPQYFTYELVLAGWVAICIATALYLFNAYRLPHDEERPNIGVPRLLFAVLFLGLGVYLLPATFKTADGRQQRPAGAVYAWVEAFLLPEPEAWGTDLKETLDRSRKSGRPVFIDFTGVTCTNCKYNELNVFPQPAVKDSLERFERVQLYTDEVPASAYTTDPGAAVREGEAEANRKFQTEVFGDIALPLYAVVVPRADGKLEVVGKYEEGKINSPDKFAAWLRESLTKAKK